MIKIIDSIIDIISLYDVFILDQWGVMHDGYKGYDHAIDAVEKLIEANKNTNLELSQENGSYLNEIFEKKSITKIKFF